MLREIFYGFGGSKMRPKVVETQVKPVEKKVEEVQGGGFASHDVVLKVVCLLLLRRARYFR